MRESDLVLLTNLSNGDTHLVRMRTGTAKVDGLGVLNFDRLLELDYGDVHEIGSTRFYLSRPTYPQALQCLERKAQVINAKDIPLILFYGDIPNARLVVEGGAGSGFLTTAMGSAIKPGGKVVTYELREDFANFARRNIETLGLADICEIRLGDITKGIEERDVDAVVVDIPTPQHCAGHAFNALRPGGVFIAYVPNTNQVEDCVTAMKETGFKDVTAFETLKRNIVVSKGGVRPDFSMLGHTGYIIYGYKLGE